MRKISLSGTMLSCRGMAGTISQEHLGGGLGAPSCPLYRPGPSRRSPKATQVVRRQCWPSPRYKKGSVSKCRHQGVYQHLVARGGEEVPIQLLFWVLFFRTTSNWFILLSLLFLVSIFTDIKITPGGISSFYSLRWNLGIEIETFLSEIMVFLKGAWIATY